MGRWPSSSSAIVSLVSVSHWLTDRRTDRQIGRQTHPSPHTKVYGVYVPCIYPHARWELLQATQVSVVVFAWCLSSSDYVPSVLANEGEKPFDWPPTPAAVFHICLPAEQHLSVSAPGRRHRITRGGSPAATAPWTRQRTQTWTRRESAVSPQVTQHLKNKVSWNKVISVW